MPDKVTARDIFAMKAAGTPIVCLTAYDIVSASIGERAGVDLLLVGDSIGNVMMGYTTTIPVELADIERAVSAVARVARRALVVADLPFGSYQVSVEQAVESSIRMMKAGAEAVKLEGAYLDQIRAIRKAGIPVMGHVGFTPQSVHGFGGFRVQGRTNADEVIADAEAVDAAGVFAVVLELIPAELAGRITAALTSPTIGIGAGLQCDGQVQVFHDIMGLAEKRHRHTRPFADGLEIFTNAAQAYANQVRDRSFPTDEQSF